MTTFTALDPALSGWRDGARSRHEALAQPVVTADRDDLVQRLLAGRNRKPDTNEVIESFGYAVHWWNGSVDNNGPAVKLSIRIGGTSSIGINNVVLNLPDQKSAPGLYRLETAHEILRTLVDIFDPDSLDWTNAELRNKQKEPDRPTEDGRGYVLGKLEGHPAGWANYLSDYDSVRFDAALLPTSATIERLGNGTLVVLGSDPAAPPLGDVLQVRMAMGYDAPDRAEARGDGSAASAASAGPTATAGPQEKSTRIADAGPPDAVSGTEAQSTARPEDDADT